MSKGLRKVISTIVIVTLVFSLQCFPVFAEEAAGGVGINVTSTEVVLDYEHMNVNVAVVPAGIPAGTKLGAVTTTNGIATAQFIQPETYGYTYLMISAQNPGATDVLVYVMDNPTIATTIHVTVANVVPTFTFTGTGNQVIGGIGITSSLSYDFEVTNDAERGAFNVTFNGPNGNKVLVNAIGAYHGTVRLPAGDVYSNISVVSQGNWTITIHQVAGTTTSLIGGSGDRVTGWINGTGENVNISIGNEATGGAFTVWLYDNRGNRKRLVNKVGTYTGVSTVKLLNNHQYYLEIKSKGNWVINFNQGLTMEQMEILQ